MAADLLAAAWTPKGAAQQALTATVPSTIAEGTGVQPHSGSAGTRSAGKPTYATASAEAGVVRGSAPDALLELLLCQGNMLLAVAVEAGASQLAAHLKDLLCEWDDVVPGACACLQYRYARCCFACACGGMQYKQLRCIKSLTMNDGMSLVSTLCAVQAVRLLFLCGVCWILPRHR
jgi:hypothetical protein